MRVQIQRWALLACVALPSLGFFLPQNEGIVWLENYGEALRQAKESHRPIFLEFRCEA